jgi:hypothetical protein
MRLIATVGLTMRAWMLIALDLFTAEPPSAAEQLRTGRPEGGVAL